MLSSSLNQQPDLRTATSAPKANQQPLTGWPRTPARRQRPPARTLPPNPRKTPKISPREKYGLLKLSQSPVKRPKEPAPPIQRPAKPTPSQFYQEVVDGEHEGSAQAAAQWRLFSHSSSHGSTPPAAATPALQQRILPKIRHALHWTKLHSKVLPKYLFVLDESTISVLFRALPKVQPARRQPPQLSTASKGAAATAAASSLSNNTAAAEADAASRSRGFESYQHERQQFILMVAATCAVITPKLASFGPTGLTAVASGLGQLQLTPSEQLARAWGVRAEAIADQFTAQQLLDSLHGLAACRAAVPHTWLVLSCQRLRASLSEFGPRTLVKLAKTTAQLQLLGYTPGYEWWASYYEAVGVRLDPGSYAGASSEQRHSRSSKPGSISARETDGSADAADASSKSGSISGSTINSSNSTRPPMRPFEHLARILSAVVAAGQQPPDTWLDWVRALSLRELQHNRYVAADAAAMLAAVLRFTLSATAEQPATAAIAVAAQMAAEGPPPAQDQPAGEHQLQPAGGALSHTLHDVLAACCDAVLQRQFVMPAVSLTAACEALAAAAAAGVFMPEPAWMRSLAHATRPSLPTLPTPALLALLRVFASWRKHPGAEWLSAFALVVQARLGRLQPSQMRAVADGLVMLRARMPTLWVAALLQELACRAVGEVAAANRSVTADNPEPCTTTDGAAEHATASRWGTRDTAQGQWCLLQTLLLLPSLHNDVGFIARQQLVSAEDLVALVGWATCLAAGAQQTLSEQQDAALSSLACALVDGTVHLGQQDNEQQTSGTQAGKWSDLTKLQLAV